MCRHPLVGWPSPPGADGPLPCRPAQPPPDGGRAVTSYRAAPTPVAAAIAGPPPSAPSIAAGSLRMDPSFTEGLSCPGHRTGSAGRTRGAEPLPTELEARRRTVLHRGAQRRPRRQPRTARLGRGWPRWCSRTRRGSGASRKVRASPAMSTSLAAEADVPLNRSLQSCVARAVVRRAARGGPVRARGHRTSRPSST